MKYSSGSYPSKLIFATADPAGRVGGTLFDRPTTPSVAIWSMAGVAAACKGVWPPNDSCGSSAQPSGMTIAYFTS